MKNRLRNYHNPLEMKRAQALNKNHEEIAFLPYKRQKTI